MMENKKINYIKDWFPTSIRNYHLHDHCSEIYSILGGQTIFKIYAGPNNTIYLGLGRFLDGSWPSLHPNSNTMILLHHSEWNNDHHLNSWLLDVVTRINVLIWYPYIAVASKKNHISHNYAKDIWQRKVNMNNDE